MLTKNIIIIGVLAVIAVATLIGINITTPEGFGSRCEELEDITVKLSATHPEIIKFWNDLYFEVIDAEGNVIWNDTAYHAIYRHNERGQIISTIPEAGYSPDFDWYYSILMLEDQLHAAHDGKADLMFPTYYNERGVDIPNNHKQIAVDVVKHGGYKVNIYFNNNGEKIPIYLNFHGAGWIVYDIEDRKFYHPTEIDLNN